MKISQSLNNCFHDNGITHKDIQLSSQKLIQGCNTSVSSPFLKVFLELQVKISKRFFFPNKHKEMFIASTINHHYKPLSESQFILCKLIYYKAYFIFQLENSFSSLRPEINQNVLYKKNYKQHFGLFYSLLSLKNNYVIYITMWLM